MAYVDGFVLVVPKRKLADYKKMATMASKVWREFGALEYRECVLEDDKVMMGVPMPKLAKAKAGETVIFAYIVYKSRKQRDAVNAKIMKDPRMQAMCPDPKKAPFDMKRMAYGGFTTLVSA